MMPLMVVFGSDSGAVAAAAERLECSAMVVGSDWLPRLMEAWSEIVVAVVFPGGEFMDSLVRALAVLPVETIVFATEDTAEARPLMELCRVGTTVSVVAPEHLEPPVSVAEPLSADRRWFMPIVNITESPDGLAVSGVVHRSRAEDGAPAILEPRSWKVRVVSVESGTGFTTLVIAGARAEDLTPGTVIASPKLLLVSREVDVTLVAPVQAPELMVHLGTRSTACTQSSPGRLQFSQPLVVARLQPFLLTDGEGVVVGGGQIAGRRVTTNTPGIDEKIVDLIAGTPTGRSTEDVCRSVGRTPQTLGDTFERLAEAGTIVGFAGQWVAARRLPALIESVIASVGRLHTQNPRRPLVQASRVFDAIPLPWPAKSRDRLLTMLAEEGRVVVVGDGIRLPTFAVKIGPRQRQMLDRLIAELEQGGINPPNPFELTKLLHAPAEAVNEIIRIGHQIGELDPLTEEVVYTRRQVLHWAERIREVVDERPFTLGEIRDALATSRKYIVPLLEHLDALGLTIREEEQRRFLPRTS